MINCKNCSSQNTNNRETCFNCDADLSKPNLEKKKLLSNFHRTLIGLEVVIIFLLLANYKGSCFGFFSHTLSPEAKIAKAKESCATLCKATIFYNENNNDAKKIEDLIPSQMARIPDDPWGNKFLLDSKQGVIYSKGSDKKAKTEDDISGSYKNITKLVSAVICDSGKNNPGFIGIGDEIVIEFDRPIIREHFSGSPRDNIKLQGILNNNWTALTVEYSDGSQIRGEAKFDDETIPSTYVFHDEKQNFLTIILGSRPILIPKQVIIYKYFFSVILDSPSN